MTFTLFDILIITTISVSSLLGIYRGMVDITINLIGFVSSIVAAIILYPYTESLFASYVNNQLASSILSGVCSYIISLIFFTFLSSKILLLLSGVTKGPVDRSLGLFVGFVRGVLFSLMIFTSVAVFTSGTYFSAEKTEDVIFDLSSDEYPEWLKDSVSSEYLEKTLKDATKLIPSEVLNSIPLPKKTKKEDSLIEDNIIEDELENKI